jgi:hypothetical protein
MSSSFSQPPTTVKIVEKNETEERQRLPPLAHMRFQVGLANSLLPFPSLPLFSNIFNEFDFSIDDMMKSMLEEKKKKPAVLRFRGWLVRRRVWLYLTSVISSSSFLCFLKKT